MKYDITLCDNYGLYQSGKAIHDEKEEELTYCPFAKSDYDSFKVQESSLHNYSDYPVRWYHMFGEEYYNLAICVWHPRVKEITFHNNAKCEVVITVSGYNVVTIPVGGSATVKWRDDR